VRSQTGSPAIPFSMRKGSPFRGSRFFLFFVPRASRPLFFFTDDPLLAAASSTNQPPLGRRPVRKPLPPSPPVQKHLREPFSFHSELKAATSHLLQEPGSWTRVPFPSPSPSLRKQPRPSFLPIVADASGSLDSFFFPGCPPSPPPPSFPPCSCSKEGLNPLPWASFRGRQLGHGKYVYFSPFSNPADGLPFPPRAANDQSDFLPQTRACPLAEGHAPFSRRPQKSQTPRIFWHPARRQSFPPPTLSLHRRTDEILQSDRSQFWSTTFLPRNGPAAFPPEGKCRCGSPVFPNDTPAHIVPFLFCFENLTPGVLRKEKEKASGLLPRAELFLFPLQQVPISNVKPAYFSPPSLGDGRARPNAQAVPLSMLEVLDTPYSPHLPICWQPRPSPLPTVDDRHAEPFLRSRAGYSPFSLFPFLPTIRALFRRCYVSPIPW